MEKELAALRAAMPTLSDSSKQFAESLLLQATTRGLSEKQLYWVRKLADNQPKVAIDLGNFSAVIKLFEGAATKLKHPKVRLQLDDGRPIVLSVAGPASRCPGTVNVTDGGKFGENTWYGRVSTDGKWDISGKTDQHTACAITALLVNFAANPAKVASLYGHKTGNCCFCSRALTDGRSVSVGYGPICADKFSLPWG